MGDQKVPEQLVAGYLEGDLSSEEREELEMLIKEEKGAGKALIEEIEFNQLLSIAMVEEDEDSSSEFANTVLTAWKKQNANSASASKLPDVKEEEQYKRFSFPRLLWISIAACFAIIGGAFVVNLFTISQTPEQIITELIELKGDIRIEREGGIVPAGRGTDIYPGDRLVTNEGASATLKYKDENTVIGVAEKTVMTLQEEKGAKRIEIETGMIECSVAPQPLEKNMILTTPHAEVHVIGTTFSVLIDTKRGVTRTEVDTGKVSVTSRMDGQRITLSVGEYAEAGKGILLAAKSDNHVELLNTQSFWRCYVVRGTEVVRTKEGKLITVYHKEPVKRRHREYHLAQHKAERMWPHPPSPEWKDPSFNDSGWACLRGPLFNGFGGRRNSADNYRSIPVFYLRGRFCVDNPAKAEDLTLDIGFHGGCAVYMNGKEVTRDHLTKGNIKPNTLAEDYPIDTFVGPEGIALPKYPESKSAEEVRTACMKRIRRISGLIIPSSMLRRGINVLAIEFHRAPLPEEFFDAKFKWGRRKMKVGLKFESAYDACLWSRAALDSLALKAKSSAKDAFTANTGHTAPPKGFHVWNWPVHRYVWPNDHYNPCEPLRPITINGAKNGVHSGRLLAGSDRPIKGIKGSCSALKGPGNSVIPSSAVEVRYGVASPKHGKTKQAFQALDPRAPAEAPLYTESFFARKMVSLMPYIRKAEYALQPIWFTVHIPADAASGEYQGTATVSAQDEKPVDVPVRLHVSDWILPDPKEFISTVGMFQSPETLSIKYKVPMWSEKHWKLIERSFRLMGEVSCKEVYISGIRRTHMGNEHSMIRYQRKAGKLVPDLTIAEKYLDVAAQYLGKPMMVCLYCWEAGDTSWKKIVNKQERKADMENRITIVDPAAGKLDKAEGPKWGTPENRAFWKRVCDGLKGLMKKKNIEGQLLLGVAGDFVPSKTALDDLEAASGGSLWLRHSHSSTWKAGRGKIKNNVGYLTSAFGQDHTHPRDPDFGRSYGWKSPRWKCATRGCPMLAAVQRLYIEKQACAFARFPDGKQYGLRGMGRQGADFWPVGGLDIDAKDMGRTKVRSNVLVVGRYPETAWYQLSVVIYMPFFFAPGSDGAMHTVRSEIARENLQEVEARIFLEKALTDPAKKAKLGEDLAERAQELLDTRLRVASAAGDAGNEKNDWRCTLASDIPGLSRQLYDIAAEAAKKLK